MAKMNYESANKKSNLSKNGSLKSRKSDLKPLVKKTKKKSSKSSAKKYSVAYTLKNNVMPFGKFKNYKICDLPTEYIKWSILNLDVDNTNIKVVLEALAVELSKRDPSLI